MCGFVVTTDIDNIQNMTERQAFRGPDGCRYAKNKDIAMGHALLDIRGVQGWQPIQTKNNNMFVFNGEAYDSNVDNDTLFLANGFETYGLRFLSSTDWHGSFVHYNTETRELTAVRDHFGAKPLWIYKKGEDITISTSLKSFTKKKYNHSHTQQYKRSRQWFKRESPYKDIIKVMPGEIFKYNFATKKLIKSKNLWDIHLMQTFYPQVPKDFEERLVNNIRKLAQSKQKTGLFLSGGLDSTIVLSVVKDMDIDLEVFTCAYGQEKTEFDFQGMRDESKMAIQTCKEWNIPINVVTLPYNYVEHYGRMWMNNTHFAWADHNRRAPRYALCQAAKAKGCKVILTGDSADEMFGGYTHHDKRLDKSYTDMSIKINPDIPKCYGDDFINNSLFIDMFCTSEQNILATDQTCGMFGLESRPVFLGQNFVKYVFAIAGKWKLAHNEKFGKHWMIQKYLLREVCGHRLPAHVRNRNSKIGWSSPWNNNVPKYSNPWVEQDISHMQEIEKE